MRSRIYIQLKMTNVRSVAAVNLTYLRHHSTLVVKSQMHLICSEEQYNCYVRVLPYALRTLYIPLQIANVQVQKYFTSSKSLN